MRQNDSINSSTIINRNHGCKKIKAYFFFQIIQIVRPYNQSEAQWWRNDINLLKTLLPFNLSSAVGLATIHTKPGIIGNSNCYMLVYAITVCIILLVYIRYKMYFILSLFT